MESVVRFAASKYEPSGDKVKRGVEGREDKRKNKRKRKRKRKRRNE